MKRLLTGNEAIAEGAWEAGCTVASAYPGTPSTEILEYFANLPDIYAEWAPNEKVALEVASGASIAGARSITTMKHVGLNVAADPLFTMAYEGVNGGFVVVSADDPGMHSSQNEQDNRFYAIHAKVVCIEPSDSSECLLFTKKAFELSEKFDTVVLLRSTTRVSHSKSIVEIGKRETVNFKPYVKDQQKYIMVPANAKKMHPQVEKRLEAVEEYSYSSELNKIEYNLNYRFKGEKTGVITSGISYQYAKEILGDSVSYLKLGITYPLCKRLVKEFASHFEKIYVIEENDPFLELQIKAMGINCIGKEIIPICDELNPDIIRKAFNLEKEDKSQSIQLDLAIPGRPPVLCAGCPHRGIFYELSKKKKAIITGDIGCYTLGMMPPLNAMDTVICMGASISAGIGMQKVIDLEGRDQKVFAVIGDSTFYHSGITGLIEAIYNNIHIAIVILDNRITAMTGHQDNPGTGKTLMGKEAPIVDFVELCKSIGVKENNIKVVSPYNLQETREAVDTAMNTDDIFVIVAKQPCALIKEEIKRRKKAYYQIDPEKCKRCKSCIRTGCPAISFENNIMKIDPSSCIACSVCTQLCKYGAMSLIENS